MSEQAPDPTDRGMGAFRRLVSAVFPAIRFFASWEYQVVAQNADGSCDCTVTDKSTGMPDLKSVPVRTGIPGATVQLGVGTLVEIAFLNGDPSRYRIVGGFDTTSMQSIELNAGKAPIGRVGDTVIVYFPPSMPFSGTIGTSPVTGIITVATPGYGTIQTGNDQVTA